MHVMETTGNKHSPYCQSRAHSPSRDAAYTLSWSLEKGLYERGVLCAETREGCQIAKEKGGKTLPEPDLLVTKFTIPPLRSILLPREHLLSVLDQSRSFPLTLLSASAGFGKTTLLSAWASQSTRQVAWLTLDEQDNDPTRFWAYVIAALRRSGSPVGEPAVSLAPSPPPSPPQPPLDSPINQTAAL